MAQKSNQPESGNIFQIAELANAGAFEPTDEEIKEFLEMLKDLSIEEVS